MTDTTTTLDAVPTPIVPAESPFRWRLAHRPDLRFGHAAGGVAGILVAAACVALVVATASGDDARLPGVGFNGALVVVALLAGWKVRGPVRSAAVAALAVAIPATWLFAVIGNGGGAGRGDFRLILLLTVASYLVCYLAPWTRGRAVLLGLALLFAANWMVFEIASQDAPFVIDVAGQAQTGGIESPDRLVDSGDKATETGLAELGIAVVLLGAGIALDRRRRAGAATPCLLVGGVYGVYAAITLGADIDNVYVAGGFVALAGCVIGLAGSLGRRRGTSWLGALVALAGAAVIVVKATTDSASGGDGAAWGFAGYAILAAAVLLGLGVLVARAFDEPVDGGEPAPAPAPAKAPPPPPPDPEPVPVAAATPAPSDTSAPPVAWSAAADTPAGPPEATAGETSGAPADAAPDAGPDATEDGPPGPPPKSNDA